MHCRRVVPRRRRGFLWFQHCRRVGTHRHYRRLQHCRRVGPRTCCRWFQHCRRIGPRRRCRLQLKVVAGARASRGSQAGASQAFKLPLIGLTGITGLKDLAAHLLPRRMKASMARGLGPDGRGEALCLGLVTGTPRHLHAGPASSPLSHASCTQYVLE